MAKFQPYILFATLLIIGFVVNEVFISCKPLQVIIANASPTDFNKKTDSFTFDSGSNGKIELRSILSGCNKLDNYFYDPNQPYLSHDKKIKVNVHFVNSLDSTQNFNGAEGIDYAKGMLHYANGKLRDNKKMNLPEGNDTPIHPLSYRYELTPNPDIPGDNGVYFHYLEEPFFLNYGKNKNNYDRKIINDLAVNLESVLNIFYMVHPPDSVSSKTYKAKEAGIALGNAVKLGVNFNKPTDKWSYAGLLNHEIGHVLGLSHAWIKSDGCDDTPAHPNCWNKGPSPCDGVISNNVMDYNSNQHSYSPCQIAKTERTLSKLKGNRRALVKKTWCTHNPKNDLVIQDTTHWNRVVDFDGNITIADGGMLILSCHLNMAEKSAITVQAGGELILHKATLYNDCGYDWNGIKLEGTKKIMGKLSYIDTFYIENVPSINL